jgi:oligoendopeptidase F
MKHSAEIKAVPRQFLPEQFAVTEWSTLEPFFKNLEDRDISDIQKLEQWMKDVSELEAVVNEDACWRQIRMTCDTENKTLEESFNYFHLHIQPHIQPYADRLNRKLVSSPLIEKLDQKKYNTYLRNIRKSIELFREENIPLQAEIAVLQQQYGQISGAMSITVNEKEYTLQQAGKFLEDPDRAIREDIYRKIQERRLADTDKLNELFDKLTLLRNKEAQNAGFQNYRDYRFKELGRFDYNKEECFQFHEAVKIHILPLVNRIQEEKRKKLQVPTLRPWDTEAEPTGVQPLRPFQEAKDLLHKSVDCLSKLDPFFAGCIQKMNELKRLDLDSRKGKAPGGYNCPLAETGAPFIFMNAAGQMHDVTTMLHEAGHAVHSFLSHPLELSGFKEYPMEIAEVASMAMELFSMEHWDVFFENKEELLRARQHQLERVITIFPWIAVIDKFQHWIYENPGHTIAERTENWMKILEEFSGEVMDFSGLEKYRANGWQRQLHLFEVPFYYIEYGIAQLGAIGLWMQFKKDKSKALENYCSALEMGGTRTLPELYKAAGLEFDFSPAKIKELMQFVSAEMDKLQN